MPDPSPLDTLLDQCERIVQTHEHLRMDTPGDEALRLDIVATCRTALDQCRDYVDRVKALPPRPVPPPPGGRDDPSAGTWWHVVPDPEDDQAETWMVQIVDGTVQLDGQPIAAREVGLALLAAAEEADRVLGDGGGET